MPTPVSEEMMQYMIDKGYIVISESQDPKLKGSATLYEFGNIPPLTEFEARTLFFELYREASKYTLVEGRVFQSRNYKKPGKHRKGRR